MKSNLRETSVAGKIYKVWSDCIARGTFAEDESGVVKQISFSGYISNDLTVRKAIACMFRLNTFRKLILNGGAIMAWYDVKFSCGHEERMQLYGPTKDRYRKIEYFERQGLCRACWEEQRRIDAEAKAKKEGLVEVEVGYREYKEKWPEAQQIPGSYNGERKTIRIYLPADQVPKKEESLNV